MNTLYKDKLIEITNQEVIFHHYYFPFGRDKRVPLTEIEKVQVESPSVMDGSWRLWGSGDLLLRTWFPLDNKRPKRDRLLFASLRNSKRRIGLTVENSQKVMSVLKERGLLPASPSV